MRSAITVFRHGSSHKATGITTIIMSWFLSKFELRKSALTKKSFWDDFQLEGVRTYRGFLEARVVVVLSFFFFLCVKSAKREREREDCGDSVLLAAANSSSSLGVCLTLVTWLILPVVICLSQRLSHACLSINSFVLCETANGSLNQL
jgi:hypothetical protein